MKKLFFIFFVLFAFTAVAQKVESISFNLYTDSLKKGVYNYINVDGKRTDGSYIPLMSDEVTFTSSAGKWDGNSLIIDSSYKLDSVVITATLKQQAEIKKNITIFIKKTDTNPPLKTEKELLDEWKMKARQKS
ncbi:hypothetical protein [Segetibacter koreensis]|uniref:hypothetical protein n=1 Tax=Segetibacter koreensis TaxID=398037 RepID=UPI000382A6A0|nr:hypothetical protein [Segetibacter koreensis]